LQKIVTKSDNNPWVVRLKRSSTAIPASVLSMGEGLIFLSEQSWKPTARYLLFAKLHLESAGIASGLLTLASKGLLSLS